MSTGLYHPTRNTRNIAYIREENDGHFSIKSISRGDVGVHILNRTAKDIFDLCDGDTEINHIYRRVLQMNAEVSLPQIKNDIDVTLKNLTALEVIEWKDDRTPFAQPQAAPRQDLGDGLGMRLFVETDLRRTADYLKSIGMPSRRSQLDVHVLGTFYLSPYCSPMEYGAVSIRTRLFQFYESLWLLEDAATIVGLAGFRSPIVGMDIEETAVANLAILCLRPGIPANIAAAFLSRSSAGCPAWLINKTITKIRAIVHADTRFCTAGTEELLLAGGYRLEAVFERESLSGAAAKYHSFHC